MPLSEDDQRRLEWIERAFRADDPLSAAAAGHGRRRRRLTEAAAVFRLGVIVLLLGVAAAQAVPAVGVPVGIAGFAAMVTAAAVSVRGRRGG
jgi:hypothetical protein